jgi:hypothetical protein
MVKRPFEEEENGQVNLHVMCCTAWLNYVAHAQAHCARLSAVMHQ